MACHARRRQRHQLNGIAASGGLARRDRLAIHLPGQAGADCFIESFKQRLRYELHNGSLQSEARVHTSLADWKSTTTGRAI
jgi:hypothetical protein